MKPVVAGKITRAFGKEGEVIATLYDTFPATYDKREPLHVYIDGLAVPLFISRFERRGKNGALFVFDDIDSEERTRIITGQEIFISPDKAVEPVESEGLEGFIGFTVVLREEDSAEAETTGMIASIEGNASNPLFCIRTDEKDILVPASEDLISGFDHSKRILYLTLPEGLLEL